MLIVTFVVYIQVAHFGFVKFDDDEDVTGNPHVLAGLTIESFVWAFTSGQNSNWIPLTRLSHIVDVQLFGLHSGLHHETNVLFHAMAVLLLFSFLNRTTQARWASALVALIFALHPLHVESVAWVAERKDVLSAFFWFLTLWTYTRYAEQPTSKRYAIVLLTFCLGLMSKPMVVTLPFVLFLVDVWPLRRIPLTARVSDGEPSIPNQSWAKAVLEKIPFLALSATACAVTYFVQKHGNAVMSLTAYPMGLRIENAIISYFIYVIKTLLPTGLAVFYPYPTHFPIWEPALAGTAILLVSILVLRSFRNRPYLTIGWLWFLGTLAPVIGIVQVGDQARADRYMYIPITGLAIMLAWGAADALARLRKGKTMLFMLAIAACSVMIALTSLQIRSWEDTELLFQHALRVTTANYVAHIALANYFLEFPERLPEAISQLDAAIQIRPAYAKAHYNLAAALSMTPGRALEAIAQYEAALQINPNYTEAHTNLATVLVKANRTLEAIPHYEAALRAEPDSAHIHYNLGVALTYLPGRLSDAIAHLETASKINPDFDTENALGLSLLRDQNRSAEAIIHLKAALRFKPRDANVHYHLGLALIQAEGRSDDAVNHFEAALQINPDFEQARRMLEQTRSATR